MTRAFRIARRIARRVLIGAALASLAPLLLASAAPAAQAKTAADSVPRCASSELEVWIGFGYGEAAAGTVYYPVEFSNIGTHACSLYGYPGVSAVSDAGAQVGPPADWIAGATGEGAERTVTLAPGATAHAMLLLSDNVSAYSPAQCHPATAAELLVYPPGASTATDLSLLGGDFAACSAKGFSYMWVTFIQPGTGIPGYTGL